jgi:hypothetical protein
LLHKAIFVEGQKGLAMLNVALWIIAIVAILYVVVRLGLNWMIPD